MTVSINAQDVIVKRDGSTIISKVLEVNTSNIKYKKYSNQDGPTYTINKADVMTINYENGEKDVFEEQGDTNQAQSSSASSTGSSPATAMSDSDIEAEICSKKPYVLFKKGDVAEYCFRRKGKQTTMMMGMGPTYLQQIVADTKVENGQLIVYHKQAFFNKKHQPSKGISATFKDYYFPVEIDTEGNYHLTHNILQDIYMVTKRRGFGIFVTDDMKQGMRLKTGTIQDEVKNGFGNTVKTAAIYTDWEVVGEENITVPAGTFNCIKITGRISQRDGEKGKEYGQQKVTCWMAREVGIVQYECVYDSDKSREPFILYLNKLN